MSWSSPPLPSILSGDIAQAGGTTLNDLVAAELRQLVVPRTPIQLALVTGKPVRSGALHSALAVAREQVFGLPAATTAPFRGPVVAGSPR